MFRSIVLLLIVLVLVAFPSQTEAVTRSHIDPRIQNAVLNPGDVVPFFSVPTINNGGVFKYAPVPQGASGNLTQESAVLVHAWNTNSSFYNAMWDNDEYVDDLLINSPNDTVYLFLSWSDTQYKTEASYMQGRFLNRMSALRFSPERAQQFSNRVFFGALPVSRLTNTFIPSLLANWTDVLNQITIIDANTNSV